MPKVYKQKLFYHEVTRGKLSSTDDFTGTDNEIFPLSVLVKGSSSTMATDIVFIHNHELSLEPEPLRCSSKISFLMVNLG